MFKEIKGGKFVKEIHEMVEILRITGGKTAKDSSKVANHVNPVGTARRAKNPWADALFRQYEPNS